MCLSPEENCEFLTGIAEGAILVCPAGNVRCSDGSSDWRASPKDRAAYVHESALAAEEALEMQADLARGDVLFGSSRGAYVARDVIYHGQEKRWKGLVLAGAEIAPEPELIKRAGIARVVLAAPDFDSGAPVMKRGVARLCNAGIPARFVSLGPHPHGLRVDSPGILAPHVAWARGEGDAGPCREPPAGTK